MKPAATPPGLDAIGDPVVRAAIVALNARDREGWFALFAEKARFSDDGITRDLVRWCDEEFFGSALAYVITVDKVEGGGLTFYARYHSDKWGDFETFWRFALEHGKVSRLDVGATNY